MRLAYTTTFNAKDVHSWSGTPFHMTKAFEDNETSIDYIGSLKRQLPHGFKLKQILNKYISQQRESPRFNCHAAKHYSSQVALRLKALDPQAILSPLINPIAYLDCKQPIILWTDAVYNSLVGFYPPFSYHSANTIAQGNAMTESCLERASLAIFSSEWAANDAIHLYGVDKNKVKVVPFGANITKAPDYQTVKQAIQTRPDNKIKLLFLAKSWHRKGGDTVLAVVKALHDAGEAVELTIVGIKPDISNLPAYVKCLGFISKQTVEGNDAISKLLLESHFLFLPSRAEAYGCVFAEASAHGLPSLTTYTGGISSAVRDNINGMTFPLNAPISSYCDYIVNTLADQTSYQALANSAYNEYQQRLNWHSATSTVKSLIQEVI